MSIAQIPRAILLASVGATNMRGFRPSMCASHEFSGGAERPAACCSELGELLLEQIVALLASMEKTAREPMA